MIHKALSLTTFVLLLFGTGVHGQDPHNHEESEAKHATPDELAIVQSLRDVKTLVVYQASFVYDLAAQPPRMFGTLWLVNQGATPADFVVLGGASQRALQETRYVELPEGGALSNCISAAELRTAAPTTLANAPGILMKLNRQLKPKDHAAIYLTAPLAAFSSSVDVAGTLATTPRLPSPALTLAVTLLLPSGMRVDPEGSPGESNLNRQLIGSETAGFAPDQERLATTACLLAGRPLPAEQERFTYVWWPVPSGAKLALYGKLVPAAAASGGRDWVVIGVLVGLGILVLVRFLALASVSHPPVQ